MAFERRWIVQDRDSALFLGMGEDGDMDFFRYVDKAYKFDDRESAALTALACCDLGGFLLFQFYIPYPEVDRS